ncbi:MAG: Nif3-like dinuclear metal center hexameric protein [Candidatus Latescibacteria bacterium]|nr:Nif3-like dinuclear metal center hexameric protein [Candidatus Latescibacterota bacterium]
MHTARSIAEVFEQIAPLDSGISGDQLGFIHGDPDREIRGVACLWAVHGRSVERCVERRLDMFICHEGIWMPEQKSPWYEGPEAKDIHGNVRTRGRLDRHDVVVYRSHSNWDALPADGVADQAVAALRIDGLREVARQRFFSVQELPEERSIEDLAAIVERGLGFTACRIFGDRTRCVRRFAFLIGGFGENQHHMPQAARDMGAEAILIGEMSEFIVIACLEMGLPVIESLHSGSEIPAIRRQAEILAGRFPDLPVEYVPSGAASLTP